MPYRVRLPDFNAHRLKETRNPSQTLVCLKTTEKISQQSAEAPEQATKEEIPVEKRVKSRKPYIPKHLRREANKEELEGFHKRVKKVPKDMSFEDTYHKYRLGNFSRESRETDKDIELLFNKVSRKPKKTLKKEQDPGKFLIPCSIHSQHLPKALCDTGSVSRKPKKTLKKEQDPGKFLIPCSIHSQHLPKALCDTGSVISIMAIDTAELLGLKELISCIEMFEDPRPTANSNREPAIPESASVNIRIAESVNIQSSESIDNQPSTSDDSQSSESIDTKPSASVDTL
ncbi:hypothetical protein F2Q69_00030568 [Brassica cretica]|uniref:Aspartic peptidase DDI1-type domain-containing protein n=1 Tax=Brassica cretica TaxID=69181 RepID=A0A8S9RXZ9_BRACR|nr:hypothetical protein F2Q69_00030568 [Brassica cretica]